MFDINFTWSQLSTKTCRVLVEDGDVISINTTFTPRNVSKSRAQALRMAPSLSNKQSPWCGFGLVAYIKSYLFNPIYFDYTIRCDTVDA